MQANEYYTKSLSVNRKKKSCCYRQVVKHATRIRSAEKRSAGAYSDRWYASQWDDVVRKDLGSWPPIQACCRNHLILIVGSLE